MQSRSQGVPVPADRIDLLFSFAKLPADLAGKNEQCRYLAELAFRSCLKFHAGPPSRIAAPQRYSQGSTCDLADLAARC